MLATLLAASIVTLFSQQAPIAATPSSSIPLFNGKDLTGWVNVNTSPNTWSVGKDEDGTPVIACTGHPTGVLRTAKMYENFVCEFDYSHRAPKTNAGFFVWSDAITAPGQPFTRSIEVQVMDGIDATQMIDGKEQVVYTSDGDVFSIHGARMTPDRPHPAGWERCLPSERRAKPSPAWNHYKITGDRGTLKLELNGKEISGASNISPRKGYLCLESEGGEVWFRNLNITELPAVTPALLPEMIATADEGFRSLFNGRDLTGWKHDAETAKHWTIDDWTLRFDGKGDHLWSEESFGDMELIVDWKWTGEAQGITQRPKFAPDGSELKDANGKAITVETAERDSGIYLRGNDKSQVNIWSWPAGSGEVYGYRTDGSMPAEVRAACTPKMNADKKVGEWNRFKIRMVGDVLNVWENGQHVIVDANLPGVPAKGPIALQSHHSGIDFGNIYVREVK
ncbi:MAG: DUF1080 domain-containing protein [Phycisphaerae bacterium]|nr:DUF1080 domain-containing protein [Phycisphaerae bacterium]